MNRAQLTYGDAADVSDHLMSADGVDVDELVAALVNAMNRIARLEGEVARMRAAAQGRTLIKAAKVKRS